jgi:hypothetical protein
MRRDVTLEVSGEMERGKGKQRLTEINFFLGEVD